MIQKINFFKYLESPVRSTIGFRRFLFIILGVALALTAIQLYADFSKRSEAKQETLQAEMLLQSQVELSKVSAAYLSMTATTEAKFKEICKVKLSQYLQAFAKAYVAGLWLTDISVTSSGTQFTLVGKATKTDLPNLYIDKLKLQPLFANFDFELTGLTGVSKGDQINTAGLFDVSIVGKVKT